MEIDVPDFQAPPSPLVGEHALDTYETPWKSSSWILRWCEMRPFKERSSFAFIAEGTRMPLLAQIPVLALA
jgi:hypothetical protein